MVLKLWIDDVRKDPDSGDWTWVHTAAEAIEWLQAHRDEEIAVISFDHDLVYNQGDDDYISLTDFNDRMFTSRPVLEWLIIEDVWPQKIVVHSHNPVGADWLAGTARRYGPDGMPVLVSRY